MVFQAGTPKIRVVVIDDQPLALAGIRLSLRRYDDIQIEFEAADGSTGVQWAAEHQPDVAVVDVWLPDMDGFEVTARLREVSPATRVIVTSGDITGAMRARASQLGVERFFQKSEPMERLAARIQSLGHSGGQAPAAEPGADNSDRVATLSLQEHELLAHLASGATLHQAASQMGLGPRSASQLKKRLMLKLDVHDGAELTHFAIREQIVAQS